MQYSELFSLYDPAPPLCWEVIDSGHGEEDLRLALVTTWPHRKLVIKAASNSFTDERRICGWRDTIEAYRALGYDCPAIVNGLDGKCVHRVEVEGRLCTVYAEAFANGHIITRQEGSDRQAWHTYHKEAVSLLARVGNARLQTAPFPAVTAILEPFAPDEEYDEVFENALEFKSRIEQTYPQYADRFAPIWQQYLENKDRLEAIYPALPRSVFQADLNPTNLLLDEQGHLQGIFDFNLAGYDTVLNNLFRESLTDFYEDVLEQSPVQGPYYKTFLDDRVHDLAMASLMDNLRLAAREYRFTDMEKQAAPLLYRYLRAFWWQPLNCLQRAGEDTALMERLLCWIGRELQAQYDFESAMG